MINLERPHLTKELVQLQVEAEGLSVALGRLVEELGLDTQVLADLVRISTLRTCSEALLEAGEVAREAAIHFNKRKFSLVTVSTSR